MKQFFFFLLFLIFFSYILVAMEKAEDHKKIVDIEAQAHDCCNPEDKEVKESCSKMKVAIITGITGLISTGVTAATILVVQSLDPK